jgi:hypothetical protein
MKSIHPAFNYIVLLVFTLSLSCVKEIPFISTQFSDDLIVNGIMKAWEPIDIRITRQIPINSTDADPVDSTLTVILSMNGIVVDTLEFSENRYRSDQIAIPGNRYSVNIVTSGGVDLYAETVVPDSISILECEFTAGKVFDEFGEVVTESSITFFDDEKEDDFYLVYLGSCSDSIKYNSAAYWQLNDPVLVNEGILEYDPSYFIFSDDMIQGMRYTLQLKFRVGYSYNGQEYFPLETFCVFQRISVEYYHFMKSFLRHRHNQQFIDFSSFDPVQLLLKGQPAELYSNIENGKGIFASYSETLKKFEYTMDK